MTKDSRRPPVAGEVQKPETAGGRRRYVAPRITDYGPVSKLTQTGGRTTKDTGNMERVCL